MRYARVSLWLLTLLIIGFLCFSVYDLGKSADTLNDQLTSTHRQIERLRAANASLLADQATAVRERERADALEGQLARAFEEFERLKIVVAAARSPGQERDLRLDLAAAQEEIELLKSNARAAAENTTALTAERARAEALAGELAEVRNRVELLKVEAAAAYAADARALEGERKRVSHLTHEVASVRQELDQLKERNAAIVAALDQDLRNARQELQRSRMKDEAGSGRQRPGPAFEAGQTSSIGQEPTTTAPKAHSRNTARLVERTEVDQPRSAGSRDVRRPAAAAATDLARVSGSQGRRPGIEPAKRTDKELPAELRPVW
jgi:septal ring factor EnvC (AmiA/AmiB activator)